MSQFNPNTQPRLYEISKAEFGRKKRLQKLFDNVGKKISNRMASPEVRPTQEKWLRIAKEPIEFHRLRSLRVLQSQTIHQETLTQVNERTINGITRSLTYSTFFELGSNIIELGHYMIQASIREQGKFELVLKDGYEDDGNRLKNALLKDLFVMPVERGGRTDSYRLGFQSLLLAEKTMNMLRDEGLMIQVPWKEIICKWIGSGAESIDAFFEDYCDFLCRNPENGGAKFFSEKIGSMTNKRITESSYNLLRNAGVFEINYQVYRGGPERQLTVCSSQSYFSDKLQKLRNQIDSILDKSQGTAYEEDCLRAVIQSYLFFSEARKGKDLNEAFKTAVMWPGLPTVYQLEAELTQRLAMSETLEEKDAVVRDIEHKTQAVNESYNTALAKVFGDKKGTPRSSSARKTFRGTARLSIQIDEIKIARKKELEQLQAAVEAEINAFKAIMAPVFEKANKPLEQVNPQEFALFFEFANSKYKHEAENPVEMGINEILLRAMISIEGNIQVYRTQVVQEQKQSAQIGNLHRLEAFKQKACSRMECIECLEQSLTTVQKGSVDIAFVFSEQLSEIKSDLTTTLEYIQQKQTRLTLETIQSYFDKANHDIEAVEPADITAFFAHVKGIEESLAPEENQIRPYIQSCHLALEGLLDAYLPGISEQHSTTAHLNQLELILKPQGLGIDSNLPVTYLRKLEIAIAATKLCIEEHAAKKKSAYTTRLDAYFNPANSENFYDLNESSVSDFFRFVVEAQSSYPRVYVDINADRINRLGQALERYQTQLELSVDSQGINNFMIVLDKVKKSILKNGITSDYLAGIEHTILCANDRLQQLSKLRVSELNKIILGANPTLLQVTVPTHESLTQYAQQISEKAEFVLVSFDIDHLVQDYKEFAREVLAFYKTNRQPESCIIAWQEAFRWTSPLLTVKVLKQILKDPLVHHALSLLDQPRLTQLMKTLQSNFSEIKFIRMRQLHQDAVMAIDNARIGERNKSQNDYPDCLKDTLLFFGKHSLSAILGGNRRSSPDEPLFLRTRLAAIDRVLNGSPSNAKYSGDEYDVHEEGDENAACYDSEFLAIEPSKLNHEIRTTLTVLREYFKALQQLLSEAGLTDPEVLTALSNTLGMDSSNAVRKSPDPANIVCFRQALDKIKTFFDEKVGQQTSRTIEAAFSGLYIKDEDTPTKAGFKVKHLLYKPESGTHTSHKHRPNIFSNEELSHYLTRLCETIQTLCGKTIGYVDPVLISEQIRSAKNLDDIPLLNLLSLKDRCHLLSMVYYFNVFQVFSSKHGERAYRNRFKTNGWAEFKVSETMREDVLKKLQQTLYSAIKKSINHPPVLFTKMQGDWIRTFSLAKPGFIDELIAATGKGKTYVVTQLAELLGKKILILSPIPVPGVPHKSKLQTNGFGSLVCWDYPQNFEQVNDYRAYRDWLVIMDECDIPEYDSLKQRVALCQNHAEILTLCGMSGTKSMGRLFLEAVALWQRYVEAESDSPIKARLFEQSEWDTNSESGSDSEMGEMNGNRALTPDFSRKPSPLRLLTKQKDRANAAIMTVFEQMQKIFGNPHARVTFYKEEVPAAIQLETQVKSALEKVKENPKKGALIQSHRLILTESLSDTTNISQGEMLNLIHEKMTEIDIPQCRVTWISPVSGQKQCFEIFKEGSSRFVEVEDFTGEAGIQGYPHPILSFYFKDQHRGTDFGDQSNFTYAQFMSIVGSKQTESMSNLLQMLGRMRDMGLDCEIDLFWPEPIEQSHSIYTEELETDECNAPS